jgi:hypothetical protein
MVPCLSGTNGNLNGMEGKNATFSSISFLYGTLVNGVEWRLNGEKFAVQPNRSPFSLPLKMNGVEWRPSPFANQTGRKSHPQFSACGGLRFSSVTQFLSSIDLLPSAHLLSSTQSRFSFRSCEFAVYGILSSYLQMITR